MADLWRGFCVVDRNRERPGDAFLSCFFFFRIFKKSFPCGVTFGICSEPARDGRSVGSWKRSTQREGEPDLDPATNTCM